MGTVRIPGLDSVRPPTALRVTCGEVATSSGGKTYPKKLGYIRITRPEEGAKSKSAYVQDNELQAQLESYAGSREPLSVPIVLLSNDLDDILSQEQAFWWGPKCRCRCNRYAVKPQDTLEEQGLPWPPLDSTRMGLEYYSGVAEWRQYKTSEGEDAREVLDSKKPILCDPSRCPFFTGDVSSLPSEWKRLIVSKKGEARKLCKSRSLMIFHIDLPGAKVGRMARLTSTGFYTAMYLRASLEELQMAGAGWLSFIPLSLVLSKTAHMVDTPQGPMRVPYWTVESRMSAVEYVDRARQLAAKAAETHEYRQSLNERSEGSRRLLLAAAEDDMTDEGLAEEFAPDVIDLEVPGEEPPAALPDESQLREQAKRMAEKAGWSPAFIIGKLSKASGGGPDGWTDLLDELRAVLAAKVRVVVDGD